VQFYLIQQFKYIINKYYIINDYVWYVVFNSSMDHKKPAFIHICICIYMYCNLKFLKHQRSYDNIKKQLFWKVNYTRDTNYLKNAQFVLLIHSYTYHSSFFFIKKKTKEMTPKIPVFGPMILELNCVLMMWFYDETSITKKF